MAAKPSIRELENKIAELKHFNKSSDVDLSDEITALETKLKKLRRAKPGESGSNVNEEWETVKIARHPKRPYTIDYLNRMLDDYYELRGDRSFSNDQAIITAIGKLNGQSVVVIGHQKGRTAEENRLRNFGMPHPEGYRKAIRAMDFAERFNFPVISIIDTPGAYPGIGAEERNIGGAIAQSIYRMSQLKVPVIVIILGEGGSGGALAIGVGDRVLMMENAIYSVISPEGCASILWRDRERAPDAAKAMKITSPHLLRLGIIDEIVPEPQGGAQRDPDVAAQNLKDVILKNLNQLRDLSDTELLTERHERLQSMGVFEELNPVIEPPTSSEGE